MPTGIGRYGIELARAASGSIPPPSVWIEARHGRAWRDLGTGTRKVRTFGRPGRISRLVLPRVLSILDGVEVVHSFGSSLPPVTPHAIRSTMIHDLGPFLHPGLKAPGDTEAWRRRIGEAAASADCLLVNSRTTMEDLLSLFPGVSGRVFHTPLGVDHAGSPQELSRTPPEGGHMLAVGIVEPRKNLERVFEAYSILSGRIAVLPPLVVAGHDGFMADEIRSIPSRLGIADRVRFTGYVDEAGLRRLYEGASILVHASLYEGFGFTVPEAFGYGLPVAASDGTSMKEIFTGACRLFDPAEPGAIADSIESCLSEGVTPSQLSNRERIFSEYTWSHCAEATLDAFGKAMGW
jgi:alpha-1,3-rhamnosyl/mannosyltransferase